jgi:hypothetical protein
MDDEHASREELPESRAYTRGHGPRGDESTEPDVLLDVPQLRVEEIILDVEDLRAHVSVEADVLNLLRLSVGADVQLGGVHLEIKGVEAQVLLKVRLDKIAEIINRVLSTVDRNPEIVGQIVPPLGAAARKLGQSAESSVEELADAVETTDPGLRRSVAETAQDTGESATASAAHAVAGAPVPDEESAGAVERTSRGLLRRRKPKGQAEEPPP